MRPAWDIFFSPPSRGWWSVAAHMVHCTFHQSRPQRPKLCRRRRIKAYFPRDLMFCLQSLLLLLLLLRALLLLSDAQEKKRDIFSADGWFNNIIYYSVSVVFSAGFIILFLDSLFLKHSVCRAPSDSGDYRWSFKDLDVFYDSILSTKCYATIVQGHLNCGSYAISAESHELHSCNILHRCINYFFL